MKFFARNPAEPPNAFIHGLFYVLFYVNSECFPANCILEAQARQCKEQWAVLCGDQTWVNILCGDQTWVNIL